MMNYYNDISEIKFELEQSELMPRIVELKERSFEDKDQYDEAPQDFADAMDSYDNKRPSVPLPGFPDVSRRIPPSRSR